MHRASHSEKLFEDENSMLCELAARYYLIRMPLMGLAKPQERRDEPDGASRAKPH